MTICSVGIKVTSLKKQPGEVFTLKEIEEVSTALKMNLHHLGNAYVTLLDVFT